VVGQQRVEAAGRAGRRAIQPGHHVEQREDRRAQLAQLGGQRGRQRERLGGRQPPAAVDAGQPDAGRADA
jgi:hypothetical protein